MEWRPVKGYEGVYEVSQDGQVKRCSSGNVIKPGVGKNGYLIVSLWMNNKGKTHYIHRLIAEHFIPNPMIMSTVNHIDGDKTNNDLSNLEWCSFSYNNKHAYENGLKIVSDKVRKSARERAIQRNKSMVRGKPIKKLDKCGNLIKIYSSVKEAAESLGVHRCSIDRALKGKTNSCKGFIFKYKEAK